MRLSRRQQLFQLARSGLGKLIDLLLRLEARLRRLVEEVRALRRQVKELKARLALNSTNSSNNRNMKVRLKRNKNRKITNNLNSNLLDPPTAAKANVQLQHKPGGVVRLPRLLVIEPGCT